MTGALAIYFQDAMLGLDAGKSFRFAFMYQKFEKAELSDLSIDLSSRLILKLIR